MKPPLLLLANDGKMQRDFTYVDNAVKGVVRILDRAPKSNPAFAPGRTGRG